ncbi:MAG: class II glutamine amidotransferase, partial [Alphaproteobacteria bacterium]
SLAEQIEAGQFFAHVRASTGTATSRVNCHPFAVDRLAFMHNGQVGEWGKVRRKIEALIPDDLYPHRLGATDSEALFLLAMAHGLPDDPVNALAKAVGQITDIMEAAKVEAPFRITAAFGDGQKTVAMRWSSDHQSPSLYYATGGAISCVDGRLQMQPGVGATLILSEPLDENEDWWTPVPDASVLIADKDQVRIEPFLPAA